MFQSEKLVAFLESLNGLYGVPGGEIRITKGYDEIFHYTFGDRRLPENEKKDYHWFYSMTKVYTMTSIMQLIEQGTLSLDTRLTEVFPSLKDIDPEIETTTLRNLMSMTGGLNYELNGPALSKLRKEDPDCMDPDRFVEAIYRDAKVAAPGALFNYSLCHDICGAILWKVTGMPLDQYMKKNIFDPLEIKDLTFFPDEEQQKRFIPQYERVEERFEPVGPENQLVIGKRFASGGAGLSGNLTAYMTMPQALANGGVGKNGYQVLKQESIDLLRTEQLNSMGMEGQLQERFTDHGLESYGYGLGVRVKVKEDGTSPIGEFGWDGAASGYILIDTDNQITVGYLQHTMNFGETYRVTHPTIRKLVYEGIV